MPREVELDGYCPACHTKFTRVLVEDKPILVGGVRLLMSTCLTCSTVTFINQTELAKRMALERGSARA